MSTENQSIQDVVTKYENHTSIRHIKNAMDKHSVCDFSFKFTDPYVVKDKLLALNVKKSTGCDGIPPNWAKQLCGPFMF